MLEPWNDSTIVAPPVHTALCAAHIDLINLRHICRNIIKVLSNQSPLHQESAVISRLIYKYDRKFRNDIGYRNLKKVNTALKKYLMINLLKDVEYFTSTLPADDEELYIPVQQMLEYVLVRLITFSKIMLRVCVCSKQAAVFYLDRVKRGESHWMSLIPYAILSRVWTMSKVLLQHSCNWYTNLYEYRDKLTPKGLDFLPKGYKLPSNIEDVTDVKNLENFGRFEWTIKKRNVMIESDLMEDIEGNMLDNILNYINQINSEVTEELEDNMEIEKISISVNDTVNSKSITMIKADFGEVISRDNFKSSVAKNSITKNNDLGEVLSRDIFKSSLPKSKKDHTAEMVINKDSLQKFITTEETYRTQQDTKSLTTHLSFMQWQALRTALLNLHSSLGKNRKIEKKFQKIWQEKCLYYK